MLLCLGSAPNQQPTNRLSKSPHIARMLGLYSMSQRFPGSLPDGGGLLDQRADVYAYFAAFAAAEAEDAYMKANRS